jgi:hypothetical protein
MAWILSVVWLAVPGAKEELDVLDKLDEQDTVH